MNKQATIFEAIASSGIFLALGTDDYLKDLRNDKSDPAQQVKMAKALRKRVLLLIDSNLTPGHKDELRAFFNDFDTVREIIFDPRSPNWNELEAELIRFKEEGCV